MLYIYNNFIIINIVYLRYIFINENSLIATNKNANKNIAKDS